MQWKDQQLLCSKLIQIGLIEGWLSHAAGARQRPNWARFRASRHETESVRTCSQSHAKSMNI